MKGTGAVIWDRPDEGRRCFEQAAALGVEVDEPYLVDVTHQLQSYEAEFGAEKAQNVFLALAVHLERLGGRSVVRRLSSYMSVNRAFQRYRLGDYAEVPPTISAGRCRQSQTSVKSWPMVCPRSVRYGCTVDFSVGRPMIGWNYHRSR